MDWKEFKKLPPNKQIEIFNSANAEIKNLAETCESLGFKKSTVQSHFTKVLKCSFNKNLGQYIPNDLQLTTEETAETTTETLGSAQTKDDNSITSKEINSLSNENKNNNYATVEQLKSLQEQIDDIKTILESKSNNQIKISDIPKVKVSVSKTLRLSPKALERFEDFCEMFPQYSKHSILSAMINKFIDDFYNQ